MTAEFLPTYDVDAVRGKLGLMSCPTPAYDSGYCVLTLPDGKCRMTDRRNTENPQYLEAIRGWKLGCAPKPAPFQYPDQTPSDVTDFGTRSFTQTSFTEEDSGEEEDERGEEEEGGARKALIIGGILAAVLVGGGIVLMRRRRRR
jgi:hypothetical protein